MRRFFPNATTVADKSCVLRSLSPAINRHRPVKDGPLFVDDERPAEASADASLPRA